MSSNNGAVARTVRFNRDIFAAGVEDWDHDMRLEAFDAELHRSLSPIVTSYQRHRNSYCRWCRLPSEILCLVFEQVKVECGWPSVVKSPQDGDPHEPATAKTGELSYDPGWINVTHVCSFWGQVALNSPQLWTDPEDLFAIPRSLAPLIVQRAQNLPMSLALHGGTHASLSDIDHRLSIFLAPSLRSCIRELYIHHISRSVCQSVINSLHGTHSGLCALHIGVLEDTEDIGDILLLPNDFCGGLSLVELHLSGSLPSRWDTSFFGMHLVNVTLRCSQEALSHQLPSASQLAEILLSLRCLETLILEDMFPPIIPPNAYPTMIFPPTLRLLRVAATARAMLHCSCLVFLSHLSLSGDIHLDIRIQDSYDVIASELQGAMSLSTLTSAVVHNILQHQSSPREIVIGAKEFVTHNLAHPPFWRFITQLAFVAFHYFLPQTPSLIAFRLESPRIDRHYSRNFLPILASRLSGISFTRAGAAAIYDQKVWWDALARAQNVRRVVVCIESCEMVLRLAEHAMKHDGTSFLFFPNLKTIHLGVDDSGTVHDLRRRPAFLTAISTLEALARLRKTVNACQSLETLIVDASLQSWKLWDTFEPYVHVRFDKLGEFSGL